MKSIRTINLLISLKYLLLIVGIILNLENFRGVWVYMAFLLYTTCKWNGDDMKNE